MATATLNDTVRIPERVMFRRVRDEMALVNAETGVYFGLDESGARIWELLAERGSLRAVAEQLEMEYDAAPEQLRHDLLSLVDELKAKGLIEVC